MRRASREKLPNERSGYTQEFTIHGQNGTQDFSVTASTYADGTVGEVFVRFSKGASSTLKGLLDGWCVMVSIALQHGVSLKAIVDKFTRTHFEPAGETGSILGRATSPLDLICRWLWKKYGGEESA